jgi:putative transcriptional regulator
LSAFHADCHTFFIYGFLKNERENIDLLELRALRHYARRLLALRDDEIDSLIFGDNFLRSETMANERLRSELVDGMRALQESGVVSDGTMRGFERKLLGKPPAFSARQIRQLREQFGVSQAVFAALLNISVSTIQKWEQGHKAPTAAALKLLQIVKRFGLEVLLPGGDRQAA